MMNIPDILLSVLKFSAIFISGLLGVAGLLWQYKEKDGNLTREGRIAVWIIVVSFFVSVISQAIEVHKQNIAKTKLEQERINEEKKTQQLLSEIKRGVYPITPVQNMSLSYCITIPLDNPELKNYFSKLTSAQTKFTTDQRFEMPGVERYLTSVSVGYFKDSVYTSRLLINDHSTLRPTKTEILPDKLFNTIGFEIRFFKDRNDSVRDTDADLVVKFKPTSTRLTYDFESSTMEVEVDNCQYKIEDGWRSNGKIASLMDLQNVNMEVIVEDLITGDDKVDKYFNDITKKATIQYLMFQISNKHLWFSNLVCKRNKDYTVWHKKFPKDIISFSADFKDEQ